LSIENKHVETSLFVRMNPVCFTWELKCLLPNLDSLAV